MRVTRWNDALAVQIPEEVAKSLDLKEGDEVELTVVSNGDQGPLSGEEREKRSNISVPGVGSCPRVGSSIVTRPMSGEQRAIPRHEYLHLCFYR